MLFTPSLGEFANRTFAVIDSNGDGVYRGGDDLLFELINPIVPVTPATDYFV